MNPISGDVQAVWVSDDGSLAAYDDNLISTSAPPAGVTVVTTTAGDTTACWLDPQVQAAIRGAILVQYAQIAAASPANGAREVRRDWSLYAEVTDSLGGIASVTLTINGQEVTPTLTAITNGYRVEYTPASPSGYRETVRVALSAIDAHGFTITEQWSFITAAAPVATVSSAPPPNVVCIRDIGLTAAEADDTVSGVPVVWLEDIVSPLIVTDIQASRVGKVAIDGVTFHEWRLSAAFLPADADGVPARTLRCGETVAVSVPALGLVSQACVLLAKTRAASGGVVRYQLSLAYFEAA
ncbi:MAG: Ig-like domain-containing protein [Desulfuromonadales bacterium]|nr:Ig-like domain-containing protein [Desulfuromonadales bacterium]